MIWKKALPGLHLLEIKYHHGNYKDDGPVMQGYFDSDCPLPILFTACKELHSEFHHQYSISFPKMMHGPRLYFDPLVDIIVIARRTTQTTQSFADLEGEGPLVYPGGDVFNEIENICFTSFDLHTALQFLEDVTIFDGDVRVKTVTIEIEPEARETGEAESDAIPWGLNARIGQPSLEEAQQTEEEQELWTSVIHGFLKAYTERFPNRLLPTVKIMAIHRKKLRRI